MRTFNKAAAIALIAGAALSVAACKKTDTTSADNSTMTEMNSTDTMMDTTANDTMATESNMGGAMDNSATSMNSSMDNSSMGGTTNNAM